MVSGLGEITVMRDGDCILVNGVYLVVGMYVWFLFQAHSTIIKHNVSASIQHDRLKRETKGPIGYTWFP